MATPEVPQSAEDTWSGPNLLKPPSPSDFVRFVSGCVPRFLVTVDTEEEFDWGAPFDRQRHSLVTIPALAIFQRFCEARGVSPIYLIDYPVAEAPSIADVLGPAMAAGRAELGVQLHPWVTPPFREKIGEFNSFAGNLPPELEQEKFAALLAAVQARFGLSPKVYRAGRYGVGPYTADMLAQGGIAIDTSVRPMFDYAPAGGPDFRDHPAHPYWIDRDRKLLELPLTTVYTGPLRRRGRTTFPRSGVMRGLFARSRLLERIPLTPEGVTQNEALRGIDTALADGLPILVLSFHSPSLAPGHTPYVRDDADLKRLYAWWDKVFAHLAARGARPASAAQLIASVALA